VTLGFEIKRIQARGPVASNVCAAVGEVHTALLGPDQRDPSEQADGLYIAPREARKRFQQFLRTETRSLASDEPYSAQLLRQQGSHRKVDIDLKDIKNYDGLLGQQLEEAPNTCLPLVRRLAKPCKSLGRRA
jgi:hypothetical protein